ncbi:MAG TPA: FkbM family methyltransferase [Opitutaceae bacterium]|nr:FkbM family methyltransferase [Opitutaceae bacterium]
MNSFFCRTRLIYRAHRYRWKLDPAEIKFVRAHAKPATMAIDIGAHKGGYAYWMTRAVGPQGRVIAFEPQPELAARLRCSFQHRSNVTIENMGLSNQCGQLTLNVPGTGPSPGASFETTEVTADATRKITVEVSTLDARLTPPHPRVSFIKCDVEGHELSVFMGAERTLREERPALLFECEQRHHGQRDIAEVFNYLGGLGYRGFFFLGNALRPLAEFNPAQHQNPQSPGSYCNNFAFLPRETGRKE